MLQNGKKKKSDDHIGVKGVSYTSRWAVGDQPSFTMAALTGTEIVAVGAEPPPNDDGGDDDGWGILAIPGGKSSPKKGGKKRGGKKPKKEEDWMTKRDRDLKHCQSVAGSWLAFSLSQSPWVSLSSNMQLKTAFKTPCNMNSLESIDEWTTAVQQALCYYVLLDMIMKEDDR